jgi:hypothetical protein
MSISQSHPINVSRFTVNVTKSSSDLCSRSQHAIDMVSSVSTVRAAGRLRNRRNVGSAKPRVFDYGELEGRRQVYDP